MIVALALALLTVNTAHADCGSFSMSMHYTHAVVHRVENCNTDGSQSYLLEVEAFGEKVQLNSDPDAPYPDVDMTELRRQFGCSRGMTPDGEAVLTEIQKKLRAGLTEDAQDLLVQKRAVILDCLGPADKSPIDKIPSSLQ